MNKTTTVVIAAGAVLAAVIVTRTPGQQEYAGQPGACCMPEGYCKWTAPETCDASGGVFQGIGITCDMTGCPPVPTVAAVTMTGDWILRAWSDGQVDFTLPDLSAGPCTALPVCGPVIMITGTCPTDINRDGDTGINDFLTLLGGWGACR